MLTFGSNLASLAALRRLNASTDRLGLSSERLASGLRINRASDDAAGLAISTSLGKDARVYSQAIRNGNDAISALAVAEGTTQQLSNVLIRMRELASQASSGTFSRKQRIALDQEGAALTNEFNRLVGSTTFNGLNLLNASFGRMNVQLGYGTSGSIGFGLGSGLERRAGNGFSPYIQQATLNGGVGDQATGDFNGDGKLDLVVAQSGGTLELGLGNGDGTFTFSEISNLGGGNYFQVESADFNGDGNLDIVATDDTNARVLYGNGNGTFKAPSIVSLGADMIYGLEIGDFNGDGRMDFAGSTSGSSNVTIMLQTAGGNFAESSIIGTANARFRLADMNGDGTLDIVAAAKALNGAPRVALGNGDGTFGALLDVAYGGTASSEVNIGDFNLDGIMDVASMDGGGSQIYISLGNGDGSFKQGAVLEYSNFAGYSRVSDVDGDGYLDIVLSGPYLTFFKGRGDGTFDSEHTTYTGTIGDGSITTGDFNGDGVTDVAMNGNGDAQSTIMLASTVASTQLARINLTTQQEAREALSKIDAALARVQSELGNIGSAQSRITSALSNLAALRENSEAARARIIDVDVASEAATTTTLKILQQTGAAVLAQANQSPALALSLLQSI